jgi:predicted lipid-binding transport protein (Tim44 family)
VLVVGAGAALYQTLVGGLVRGAQEGLVEAVPRLLLALALVLAGLLLAGVVRFLARRALPSERQRQAFNAVTSYAIYAIAALAALSLASGQLANLASPWAWSASA